MSSSVFPRDCPSHGFTRFTKNAISLTGRRSGDGKQVKRREGEEGGWVTKREGFLVAKYRQQRSVRRMPTSTTKVGLVSFHYLPAHGA